MADKGQPAIIVIGGGLAGCEAVRQVAKAGLSCTLYEMKPVKFSPAHRLADLGELVCSNSLKSESLERGPGLLKEELNALGSLVMEAAYASRVPAGSALAVDREGFARKITAAVEALPNVIIVREELTRIPEQGLVIIATGPLTSEPLSHALQDLIGESYLSFYDAIAPIVEADSIDMSRAFFAARYGKGGDDYINCPMSREEYERFYTALLSARRAPMREFENVPYFEGCLPIEVMAERGPETLVHGPLKPVGLTDPRTGQRPYAVVQLRQDDLAGQLYNMVGFQTRLAYPEQERVFRMIPGLEHAEFARLGSMHRNTFVRSPGLLMPDLSLKAHPRVFLAGQLTGVEGYLESAAMGLLAGISAARRACGLPMLPPPPETMLGSLVRYITNERKGEFQPMNANFGILPPLASRPGKRDKRRLLAERAIRAINEYREKIRFEASRVPRRES